MRETHLIVRIAILLFPGACLAAGPAGAIEVLARRCIDCHGPATRVSGLDLSTKASALRGGSKGPALKPGSAAASLLMQRVELGQMPPTGALAAPEKESLRLWIDSGAPWTETVESRRAGPDWWSLQPLRSEQPPPGTSGLPIDRWIIAELREKGLTPSKPADRRTLIRRVTYDLTGLPPAPEEIESFLADPSGTAYEKLVDRLLASPHYGERWARHWLDVVRFSESEGFERDLLRDLAWPYRDYVINSLNQDKPYIQFAREQIAGDVLEPVTHDSIIATGFLVAGPTDAVGLTSAVARERDSVREDQLEELTGAVSQTFLGLTVNCARCHDHKFDPIPQRDYYSLKAALSGVWQPFRDPASIELLPDGRPLLTPLERKSVEDRKAPLRNRARQIEEELSRLYRRGRDSKLSPEPMAQWTFDTDARDQIVSLHANLGETAQVAEGRLRPAGDKESVTIATPALTRDVAEKTLEAWILVRKPPEKASGVMMIRNRSGYRGAALDGIQYAAGKAKQWENQSTARFRSADVSGPPEQAKAGDRIHLAIVYARDGTICLYRNGVLYGNSYRPGDGPLGLLQTYPAGDAFVEFTASKTFELDEARLYATALTADEIAASFAQGAPSIAVDQLLASMSPDRRAKIESLEAELQTIRKQLNSFPESLKAFASDARDPGITHVLQRGDVSLKGDIVAPSGLSCVRGLPASLGLTPAAPDADRRRKLAEWIANPANPIFARVMVNRVWHYHFGAGLAENPNDLGYNGGIPSHPRLLDWLAGEFIRDGWSLKKLHKLILISDTYRQSSGYNEQAGSTDAGNRLLWRYAPRRLEGEAVRDAMLAVSGNLNRQAGGPSFRAFTVRSLGGSYSKYEPRDSDEPALQRRTVYRMNVNTGADPMLESLDCPVPSVKTPKRPSTTTPLQALSLMNGAFPVRLAKAFASRLEREAGSTDARIERAFQLALGRKPTPDEIAASRALVNGQGLEALCWGLFNASEFLFLD